MVRKRPINRKELAKQQLRVAYGKIRDRWPGIAHLTLELHYFDDNDRPFDSQTLRWGPEQSAFVEFPCRDPECIGGGFDLNDVTQSAIQQVERQASGELTCMGWQDRERVGKHRCLFKLQYTLQCQYQVDVGGR